MSVPLADVLQALRTHSHVAIDVDWPALHAIGIEPTTLASARIRDTKVRRAVNLVLKSVNGDDDHKVQAIVSDDDRSIWLTSMAVVQKTCTDHDYPVADLLNLARGTDRADRLETVAQYIQQNVDANSWKDAGGDFGTLNVDHVRFLLRIHQTPSNHREIAVLLANLRDMQRLATGPATHP